MTFKEHFGQLAHEVRRAGIDRTVGQHRPAWPIAADLVIQLDPSHAHQGHPVNDQPPRDASPAERAQEELLQLKNRAVAKALFGWDPASGPDELVVGLIKTGRVRWRWRVPQRWRWVVTLLQRMGLVK